MLPVYMSIDKINRVWFGNNTFPAGAVNKWKWDGDHCELILKISGESIITFDGETFTETAGTVRFLPGDGCSKEYITETVETGSYYYFCFKTENSPSSMLHVHIKNFETMELLFARLWRTWTMKAEGWYHRALGIAYEIFAELEHNTYLPSAKSDILAPAISEIEHNLSKKIDISSLHKKCGISYTYFKELFKQRFGLPPQKYYTKLRMNIACEQLKESQCPIGFIAENLGYSSVQYFSRQFKTEIGCTAEEYRRISQSGKGEVIDTKQQRIK